MRKKQKIKSRCANCNQMNKYKKKNWKGREHTKCNYCGMFLVKNLSLCKEVKQNKMENQNIDPALYEAIKPVRDGNGNGIKKGKKKWWLLGIILLCIFGGWYFAININGLDSNAPPFFALHGEMVPKNISLPPPGDPDLCSQVKAVPSWAKDGRVVAGGYQLFKPGTIDKLIEEEITFIYSSTCSYCHKQIEDLGDDWERYVDSGLTKKCW